MKETHYLYRPEVTANETEKDAYRTRKLLRVFIIAVIRHQSTLLIKACSPLTYVIQLSLLQRNNDFSKHYKVYHCAYMFIPGIPGPPKAFSGGLIAPP